MFRTKIPSDNHRVFLLKGVVGILSLFVMWGSLAQADEPQWEHWNECEVTAREFGLAGLALLPLCAKRQFVMRVSNGQESLLSVARNSRVAGEQLGFPFLAVDLDSVVPSIHFLVQSGEARQSSAILAGLLENLGGFDTPTVYMGPREHEVSGKLLFDGNLAEISERLRISIGDLDGVSIVAATSSVALPDLEAVLISAALTEAGREYFAESIGAGLSMHSLFSWQVNHQFPSGLTLTSSGSMGCVQEGLPIVDPTHIDSLDPVFQLLSLPLANYVWLRSC